MVPLKEWIVRSRAVDADDKAEVAGKPALKILDWLGDVEAGLSAGKEGLKHATANGREASETMRELAPVSEEWMGHWSGELGLWEGVAFIMMCVSCICNLCVVLNVLSKSTWHLRPVHAILAPACGFPSLRAAPRCYRGFFGPCHGFV